jgi:NAD(P)H-dependent FMN reductase
MAKIVLMAMSLRKDSLNKKLINESARLLSGGNPADQFEVLSFNDFAMPVYDGDIESQ